MNHFVLRQMIPTSVAMAVISCEVRGRSALLLVHLLQSYLMDPCRWRQQSCADPGFWFLHHTYIQGDASVLTCQPRNVGSAASCAANACFAVKAFVMDL